MTSSIPLFVSTNGLSVFLATSVLVEAALTEVLLLPSATFSFSSINQFSMPTEHFSTNCFLCSNSDLILASLQTLKLSLSSMLDFSTIKLRTKGPWPYREHPVFRTQLGGLGIYNTKRT